MMNFLGKTVKSQLVYLILGLIFLGVAGFVVLDSQGTLSQSIVSFLHLPRLSLPENPLTMVKDLKKFSSAEDFANYLQQGENSLGYLGGMGEGREEMAGLNQPAPVAEGKNATSTPDRVSQTNVQVVGIDEPDILKTSGQEIYFSNENYYYWRGDVMPMVEKMIAPGYSFQTKLVKAFPPADLKQDAQIDKTGNLLLSKNILVVFGGQEIFGYDVSNSQKPEQKWNLKFEYSSSVASARLYQDKIYLVVKKDISPIRPCPIEIMKVGDTPLTIRCEDIYHPVNPISIDTTFTALILDPADGQVEKTISFVGSSGSSMVYMSPQALYITYSSPGDAVAFFLGFLKEKGRDLFPASLIERVEKLSGYDISQLAKMTELQLLFQQYQNSLKDDERLKLQNEVTNRMSDYSKAHMRELEKTGIAKINLGDFQIKAVGNVPGHPLNQFSLDEYQDNLRIAVTVGQGYFGYVGFNLNNSETANDVYVLGKDLKVLGQVQNLGLGERIYSARFVEDKGYLVTFKETDPFYVLELSDPRNPVTKGELKIPGFSSYLHPVSKDLILGIGRENSQVKLSLFDVSQPANPKELAKYILDESWSDILNTHHAFLLDTKHQIFFLPGSQGAYVFSYKDGKLEMKTALAQISAKRAIYLNDYLYVVGENKITVLNELDWTKVNELTF